MGGVAQGAERLTVTASSWRNRCNKNQRVLLGQWDLLKTDVKMASQETPFTEIFKLLQYK